MFSHSQRLRHKIELVRPPLNTAAGLLWKHPRLPELFPEYLFAVHCISRATVPSMRVAAERARAQSSSDPVAKRLAQYYEEHSDEEVGHDEWTLDDLEALGIPRSQILKRPPSPAVAALVGSQYYWAHHYHPIAYMGYVAVLEPPASVEFLEETIIRTGLPRAAFGTHFKHAQLDPHHVAEFDAVLDQLPLTPEHSSMLGISAFATVQTLTRIFEEVVFTFEQKLSGVMAGSAAGKA